MVLLASTVSWSLWLPALSGIASHHLLFAQGEWHLRTKHVLLAYIALALAAVLVQNIIGASGFDSLVRIPFALAVYLSALVGSIVVYRVCFHRLSRVKIPGPFLARVTKLWHLWNCRYSKNYLVMDRLYHKYGDFVRTGPEEVAVFHPEIYWALDGPGSHCTKSEWYDMLHPSVSLVSTRDPKEHETRRRIWDKGFTKAGMGPVSSILMIKTTDSAYVKAVLEYAERTSVHVNKLSDIVSEKAGSGSRINVTELFSWFSFDVMGDFVFCESFGMLDRRERSLVIQQLRSAMNLLGPFGPMPWLAHMVLSLLPQTWRMKDWWAVKNWASNQMRRQIDESKENPCLAQILVAAARENGFTRDDMNFLDGDSVNAIIAGSDTTRSASVFLFYHLATDESMREKLQEELSSVEDVSNVKDLQLLPHLNGAINETLRLYPPVLSAGWRKTPPSGLQVGDQLIPGGITVGAPRYTIFRREDCFTRASEFIPERWYSKPEMVKTSHTFSPFALGRFNCIGKQFALNELRLLTAAIVTSYNVALAPGYDPQVLSGDMFDAFASQPGDLELTFTRR